MAKIKIDNKSLIHVELKKLEAKVKQFQDYLERNNINTVVTESGEIVLTDKDQEALHKEMLIQIKVQDALFAWLPLLEKLKQGEQDKADNVRGNTEIGGMFK